MTPTVKDHVMPLTTADLRKICDALKHDHERKLFVTQAAFRNAATPARVRAMLDEIDVLTARAEAAEALVKEAGEVVRPLAEVETGDCSDDAMIDHGDGLTVAEARRAAAFLAKIQPKDATDE